MDLYSTVQALRGPERFGRARSYYRARRSIDWYKKRSDTVDLSVFEEARRGCLTCRVSNADSEPIVLFVDVDHFDVWFREEETRRKILPFLELDEIVSDLLEL